LEFAESNRSLSFLQRFLQVIRRLVCVACGFLRSIRDKLLRLGDDILDRLLFGSAPT
jgi:hypothetical protein